MYFYRRADSMLSMTIGDRIEERRKAAGIRSQSALARRVGMSQSTLNGLINRPYRWSPHLPRLARELGTTVDYLVGDIDDPDEGAPPAPPRPAIQHVMLPVALPSEDALAEMFEGLIEGIARPLPPAELARELAQLLPTALSQARSRPIAARPASQAAPGATLSNADRELP